MIYKVTFERIKGVCKFCHDGYENGEIKDTCRNKFNKPTGCSWGECNSNKCPLLKVERRV